MWLLFQAALRTKKHLILLVATFLSLIFLTVASQLEVFALGILSNNGSDFFALFPKDQMDGVSLSQIQENWNVVADPSTSLVTNHSAAAYLAEQKQTNPLNWILNQCKKGLDVSSDIKPIIILLLCVAAFKAFWLFASRYSTQLLSIRISKDLRQQYFEHIQLLPMSFYQKYNIGSLSSRVVGDAGQIALSINSWLTNYLQTPFVVVTCLSMCFYVSWKLSLVIFVGIPLIVMPIVVLARRVKKVSRQLQTNQEKFASLLIDFLAGIQTVKIFSMEAFSLKKYKEENDKMAHLESKAAKYGLMARPILHGVTTLCLAVIVLFGLYVLGMTFSQLIVFCALLHLIYEPIKKFAEENASIQRGIVAAERMFEVLDLKPHIEDKEDAIDLQDFKETIEFDRVWFRYQGEWILKDVSFSLKKGETLAIVGPTGSGKSTIVQLLPRLYDVEKGEVRIDGKPVQSYTQKSLRKLIAFVAQKPFLFVDTVAENITVGKKVSKEALELASKRAHAEEFICRLPNQYETILAETGKNLSGGQQQRLAIARALVCNAPILIMDEATSSLDAISENHIKDAICSLQGEVTQILIAHRLSTIEHADKILYLEHGEKIAEGTKDELLANCLPFRLMWEAMYRQNRSKDTEAEEIPAPV